MAVNLESARETHLVVPAAAMFLAWLAAHLLCTFSGILAVAVILGVALFSIRAITLRLREPHPGRLAPVGLGVLVALALGSLLLPIWNHHPGLGEPPHAHFIYE